MSSFYDRSMSSSRVSLDTTDRSYSRSPSRSGMTSSDDLGSSRGYHTNSSSASLGSGKGGAPMHAMMVPGVVVPTIDRPEPDSPFSQWEAYIVKQAQEWNDKRTKALASPPPPPSNNSPRVVWADQIRKAAPQSQPFTYTKARDRVASPPPQGPPPPNPRGLLRKPSFDVFRNNSETGERSGSTPSPSTRPSISSPILTKSILTTVPPTPIAPVPIHAATSTSYDSLYSRSVPDPLQVPHNVESQTSSIRSLSPLPLSLPGDDFSASLLINLDKRSSTASTSSGRAPGPSELIAAPLPAIFNSENSAPPSIADTYSVHSRRSSWASSIDLDPAIICTPPLSHDGWQEQCQTNRPAFLAEYGLDQDTDESEPEETECSVYPDDDETGAASLHTVGMYSNEAMQQQQQQQEGPAQPVFQRLEADLLSLSGHGDDMNGSPRFGPDGTPLPRLEISSLPREKEEIRKARARLISPVSFKKAFSIKKKGSNSGSSGSQSAGSSPSLPNSSSEEVGKVNNDAQTPVVSRLASQSPSLMTQDMTSWAAAIPAEAPPTSPVELPASPMPTLQLSPSIDSYAPTVSSTDGSSAMPISPVFSNPAPSIASETSRDGLSSLNSFANGSISGQRRHRVATPGLTKVPSSPTDSGAAASLDPHLMRVKTRARSSGSVSSHTPSIALSNTSSTNGRRTSRRSGGGRSGRSRITDSMPSFANMASSLAVPVSDQRRFSNRSLSSEGSIDNHSNASNGSSYAKVGGSSDDGMPVPLSPSASSMTTFKSVLRKRVPSEDGSLLSPKKEVSFDLPVSTSFGVVAEGQDEEEEELLEHEQRQRGHLKLPPMKLQKESTAAEDVAAAATSEQTAQQSSTLSQDDQDILTFLSSFGRDIKTVESLGLLDNIHAGSNEWPKREDWDSLPAYLMAYATTFLSAYSDDSATLVYSTKRAPARISSKSSKIVSAPLLSSNPLYTSIVRSLFRIASWDQPLVSAGVSSIYAYSWTKGKLAAMIFVGLALLIATQGAQMRASSSSSSDAQELSAAYSRIAPVLLGSASTHERMRNLMLWRSPKASLRFTGLLLALALGATRFDSSMMLQFPGLFVGLALFVWLPIILHQPEWAPEWIRSVNPVDVLLYDVPTDAQYAILTLRRRAASGDQLVHHPVTPSRTAALKLLPPTLSPTAFDHRVSTQELTHITDILESSHFATFENSPGHLIILASRLIFRTLSSPPSNQSSEEEEQISLADDLIRSSASSSLAKITLDARLEKVVKLEKTLLDGLQIKLRNGQVFQLQGVAERDVAFNRLLALAPQKWH
ncbi:uncharacterized protein UTRI_05743 [Ustilago trichophora]|uniref:Uncharacterized protein n=1 Tax=Ustilago trichophora TaxID=86804 RepID=A0A5C3EM19_9BASI|nr:uncharacterized protein UTRI_05743 [Ustilago trichophora]